MTIGYLTRKNQMLSEAGEVYLQEIRRYLQIF